MNFKTKILVIEDDEDIQELLRYNLSRDGYSASIAASGEDGISMLRSTPPDLILLDLMLPGIGGLDVCRIVKNDTNTQTIPIIMITAKGDESDIVAGLELGADDYITKPFSVKVVIARIRSLLRRITVNQDHDTSVIKSHGIEIIPEQREVLLDGHSVDLTFSEFAILQLFFRRPGWVFTRYQIVDAVHGEDHPVSDRSVDVQIVGLRKKLGNYGNKIETIRGVGYRFKE